MMGIFGNHAAEKIMPSPYPSTVYVLIFRYGVSEDRSCELFAAPSRCIFSTEFAQQPHSDRLAAFEAQENGWHTLFYNYGKSIITNYVYHHTQKPRPFFESRFGRE
jgi:hypothetical protein